MSEFLPSTKFINVARTVTGTVDVEDSDQVLNCDTDTGTVTIDLKKIPADYWSTLSKLYIKDFSENSSVNNITIVAPTGYKINNQQSIIINVDGGSALVRIGSNTDYVAELNYGIVGNNSIPVQNTAYVMKNGSDTTGLIERFDKPFLTIIAAVNAIRAAYPDNVRTPDNRFKIICEDGHYNESIIYLFPYIDFDFGNSVITSFLTDNFAVAVTYSANPNNDFTTKILGNARIFRHTAAVSTTEFTNVNSRILIHADTISSDRDDAIMIMNGYVRIICNKIYNNNTVNLFRQFSHAIEMHQGNTGSAPFPACTLEIIGADIFTLNDAASTINFGSTVNTTDTLNQTLTLINCRVVNSLGSGANDGVFSAISVGVTHAEQVGSVLNLQNTVLYSKYGRSIFVSNATAKANLTVYYYNSNSTNINSYLATPDANHTLTEYIKTTGLVINTGVLPIIP